MQVAKIAHQIVIRVNVLIVRKMAVDVLVVLRKGQNLVVVKFAKVAKAAHPVATLACAQNVKNLGAHVHAVTKNHHATKSVQDVQIAHQVAILAYVQSAVKMVAHALAVQRNHAWSDAQAAQTVHQIANHVYAQNAALMAAHAHAVQINHAK